MGESFLRLPPEKRREELEAAENASDRSLRILEKDVWIVWALETLFSAPFGEHLVFKGGTSLSKGYGVIRRFSEDVDITYDIREIIHDLVGDGEGEPLPPNHSQGRKWISQVRRRLEAWVAETVVPVLDEALRRDGLSSIAKLSVDERRVLIDYEPLTDEPGYVKPPVILEIGARSTGEPWEPRPVVCEAAEHLPTLDFPTVTPRVMLTERTFWEKLTAAHVYCLKRRLRAQRFSRHWYDIVRLDDAGCADRALKDRELAIAVAKHKKWFYVEKDAKGIPVDYEAAVSGNLRLVPDGEALKALAEDYNNMAKGGMLLDNPDSFDDIMDRCRGIEEASNGVRET